MPEDSKTQERNPKEQRKPRSSRHQSGKNAKKTERVEESKYTPKVPQKPPVYEDPGPEFYKNLKRETEEIIKITEEENSKYKKKEIQSNWSKYEMPIETYEDIEEQDLGADYEKLIQTPLTVGGHFQFKHEKSWDENTGPSKYDKYFDINMDKLSLAVSTIPFYIRNNVDQALFTESDMLSMTNRATKYKQKYFDDKSYATPEAEAETRILHNLISKSDVKLGNKSDNEIKADESKSIQGIKIHTDDDIHLDFNVKSPKTCSTVQSTGVVNVNRDVEIEPHLKISTFNKSIDELDVKSDTIHENRLENVTPVQTVVPQLDKQETPTINIKHASPSDTRQVETDCVKTAPLSTVTKPKVNAVDAKTPVIESPEDLEKWLDDFLDDS